MPTKGQKLTKKQKEAISNDMKQQYIDGRRDRFKTVKKAQKVSHKKMKENNWLNSKESRNKLRIAINKKEYRKKMSDMRKGKLNPMYGRKGKEAGHYKGGSIRKYGTSYRGFDWKNIKKTIKKRDEYKCRVCGISESECKQNLQIHHIVPYKCTQDNNPDNLITLCSKCHAKEEFKFYKIKKITKKQFKGKVYNMSVKDDETYTANKMIVHNCRTTLMITRGDKQ